MMDSTLPDQSGLRVARLRRFGLLSVAGDDARSFLHAQLTNDIDHLPADQARLAGWCSAKGRLLASFIVVPRPDGFLLQLAADLVPPVAKRLGMFVLRAKVKISDLGQRYSQLGVWGGGAAACLAVLGVALGHSPMAVTNVCELSALRVERDRILVVAPLAQAERIEAELGAR